MGIEEEIFILPSTKNTLWISECWGGISFGRVLIEYMPFQLFLQLAPMGLEGRDETATYTQNLHSVILAAQEHWSDRTGAGDGAQGGRRECLRGLAGMVKG